MPRAVGRRVLASEARRQRSQLGARLVERDARLEPEQRLHEVRAAAVLRQIPGEPLPQVGLARKLKACRHDAGHRERLAVHGDDPSDDRRIRVEALAPQPVADHRQRFAREERRGGEARPQNRLDADDREEIRARFDGGDAHRLAARLGEIHLRIPPRRRVVEHLRQGAVIHEIDGREPFVREALRIIRLPDHGELIRIRVGKRPEHDAIEYREHGGRRADAERQRQHRRNREPGTSPQQAPAEPDVVNERVHVAVRRMAARER